MNSAAPLRDLPVLLAALDGSTNFNTGGLRKDLITAVTSLASGILFSSYREYKAYYL
jgi:hypothetical protein